MIYINRILFYLGNSIPFFSRILYTLRRSWMSNCIFKSFNTNGPRSFSYSTVQQRERERERERTCFQHMNHLLEKKQIDAWKKGRNLKSLSPALANGNPFE